MARGSWSSTGNWRGSRSSSRPTTAKASASSPGSSNRRSSRRSSRSSTAGSKAIALFYEGLGTFRARPFLYLEDLVVSGGREEPRHRRRADGGPRARGPLAATPCAWNGSSSTGTRRDPLLRAPRRQPPPRMDQVRSRRTGVGTGRRETVRRCVLDCPLVEDHPVSHVPLVPQSETEVRHSLKD